MAKIDLPAEKMIVAKKKKSKSEVAMISIAAFCFAATIAAGVLRRFFGAGIFLTLAITFGTATYHLAMRLLVGSLYNVAMKNRADYAKKRYRARSWEKKLYRFLKVKKWKNKMPTYCPEAFSVKIHDWSEIAQATCQAELVHETNMILSFLPCFFIKRFGAFYAFFITSFCGALFDFLFVMIQRHNRERIISALQKRGIYERV